MRRLRQAAPFLEGGATPYQSVNFNRNYDDPETNGLVAKTKIDALLCPAGSQVMSQGVGESEWYTTHYYGIGGSTGQRPGSTEEYAKITKTTTLGAISDNGILGIGRHNKLNDIYDGTSNTALFFESSWDGYKGYRGWQRGTYVSAPGKDYETPADDGYWHVHSVKYLATPFFVNAGIRAKALGDLSTTSGTGRFSPYRVTGLWTSHHPGGTNFAAADGTVRFLSETVSNDVFLSLGSAKGGENYLYEGPTSAAK